MDEAGINESLFYFLKENIGKTVELDLVYVVVAVMHYHNECKQDDELVETRSDRPDTITAFDLQTYQATEDPCYVNASISVNTNNVEIIRIAAGVAYYSLKGKFTVSAHQGTQFLDFSLLPPR